MAFLRTVLRYSVYKKYGYALTNSQDCCGFGKINQIALKSTAATGALIQDNTAAPVGSASPKDPLDITFEDSIASFKSKTTWELLRAYVVYTLCSFETLVEHNMKVSLAAFDSYVIRKYRSLRGVLCVPRGW